MAKKYDPVWLLSRYEEGELMAEAFLTEEGALAGAMTLIDRWVRYTSLFKDPGKESPYTRIEEWNTYAHARLGDLSLIGVSETVIN